MPDINVHRTHSLGLKGAKAAADKMAARLEEKFDLVGEWRVNTFVFSRPGVNGTLIVSEEHLKLDVTLGFLLKMMKGPIEQAVHEQLDIVLASKKSTAPPKVVAEKKPGPKKK